MNTDPRDLPGLHYEAAIAAAILAFLGGAPAPPSPDDPRTIGTDSSRPAGPGAVPEPDADPGASTATPARAGGTIPPHIVAILCRFERKVQRAIDQEERAGYRPLNGRDY